MTDLDIYLEGLRGNLSEGKSRTYADAKLDIWDELYDRGWQMSSPSLKVPHATHPHLPYRLWFKPQALYSEEGKPFSLGNARSLGTGDLRRVDAKKFADWAEKLAEKTRSTGSARYDF